MQNFVALGCLEVGEKFTVGGLGWWAHFHTKYKVTPTLSWVRLRLGWAVTIEQFFTTIINRKKWSVFQYIVDFIRFNVEITFFTRKSPFVLK